MPSCACSSPETRREHSPPLHPASDRGRPGLPPGRGPDLAAETWTGQVGRVVDADTLDVIRPDGAMIRVRLFGVDAPEAGQPGGEAATAAVRALIEAARGVVAVTPLTEKELYNRLVARVEAAGKDLSAELARSCLAWVDPRYCLDHAQPDCAGWRAHETRCRAKRRGIFKRPGAIFPWDWRAAHPEGTQ